MVQDPSDAAYAEMPTTALIRSKPDHIASLASMPALFDKLVRQPVGQPAPVPEGLQMKSTSHVGKPVACTKWIASAGARLACPDCHGVMWRS